MGESYFMCNYNSGLAPTVGMSEKFLKNELERVVACDKEASH